LEIHMALHEKLQACQVLDDMEAIRAVIKQAEDQGIRTGSWTLPSGADDLALAEGRIAELQAEKDAEEKARKLAAEKLVADLKGGLTSGEREYVKELMQRGMEYYPLAKKDEFPEEVGVLEDLQKRLDSMSAESELMKRMQACVQSDDTDAFEALEKELEGQGKTSEDGWILSEGYHALENMRGKFDKYRQVGFCLERMKKAAAGWFPATALSKRISTAC